MLVKIFLAPIKIITVAIRNNSLNFILFISITMSYNHFEGFGAFAPPLYLRAFIKLASPAKNVPKLISSFMTSFKALFIFFDFLCFLLIVNLLSLFDDYIIPYTCTYVKEFLIFFWYKYFF